MNKLFKIFLGLFIVLIPFQTRWIFFEQSLDGQLWEYGRLSIYITMIILLFASLFFALSHKKEIYFSKNKYLYFIFAYSIIISLLSPFPIVSLYYLGIIYTAVLFTYLLKFVSKKYIFTCILFSGLVQSIIALQQLFQQKIVANKWFGIAEHLTETLGTSVVEFMDQRFLRVYGLLPHPNILAGFLFLTIFSAIYLWIDIHSEKKKEKWINFLNTNNIKEVIFILITLVLSTYALLATFSRSAVLALIISLFSVLLINIFKNKWIIVQIIIKYIVLFIVIFYSFNLYFPNLWNVRLEITGRLEAQSIEERVDSFSQINLQDTQHTIFGQGLGMNTYFTYNTNNLSNAYDAQPIHNIFILLFAEIGIIGVFILLSIVKKIIESASDIDLISSSILLGFAIIGLFDHYIWTSYIGWLLSCLAISLLYKRE